jgi:molybdopterin-guanine dinucleotide biosynthesis protein A
MSGKLARVDGALILAGGRSTRMGRDKTWLELDGRSLLEHVLAIVSGCCAPIVVSARPGQALPPLPGEAERVDDPIADAGPLIGVIAGLERLAARRVELAYLGSCDAAGLGTAHVSCMLDALRSDPTVIMAVPVEREQVHPLAAAVRVAAMLTRARERLAASDHRLRALAEGPQVLRIDVAALPDPRVLAPCNTPEQWGALRRGATRTGG